MNKSCIILKNMAIILLCTMSIVLFSCDDGKGETRMMTMTIAPKGGIWISMEGTGPVTIDWGDGSNIYRTNLKNPISEFISGNTKCEHFYADQTPRTITITGNVKLLSCFRWHGKNSESKLTSIDVSKNDKLVTLFVSDHQLTSMDVSGNKNLQILSCQKNQLRSFDLSQCPQLKILSCEKNRLTDIDLSKNFRLTMLSYNDNLFDDIDLSKNTRLREVNGVWSDYSEAFWQHHAGKILLYAIALFTLVAFVVWRRKRTRKIEYVTLAVISVFEIVYFLIWELDVWFVLPQEVGWMKAIIGFIVFGLILFFQFILFLRTYPELIDFSCYYPKSKKNRKRLAWVLVIIAGLWYYFRVPTIIPVYFFGKCLEFPYVELLLAYIIIQLTFIITSRNAPNPLMSILTTLYLTLVLTAFVTTFIIYFVFLVIVVLAIYLFLYIFNLSLQTILKDAKQSTSYNTVDTYYEERVNSDGTNSTYKVTERQMPGGSTHTSKEKID